MLYHGQQLKQNKLPKEPLQHNFYFSLEGLNMSFICKWDDKLLIGVIIDDKYCIHLCNQANLSRLSFHYRFSSNSKKLKAQGYLQYQVNSCKNSHQSQFHK